MIFARAIGILESHAVDAGGTLFHVRARRRVMQFALQRHFVTGNNLLTRHRSLSVTQIDRNLTIGGKKTFPRMSNREVDLKAQPWRRSSSDRSKFLMRMEFPKARDFFSRSAAIEISNKKRRLQVVAIIIQTRPERCEKMKGASRPWL